MSSHAFGSRSQRSLAALDFGLRVRVDTCSEQRTLFSGADDLSVHDLVSELAEMVSGLRVRSFALRAELEQVMSALMVNTRCGFWPLARRAAFDLAGLLAHARKRHFADPELCYRGANGAHRIAELCGREVQ